MRRRVFVALVLFFHARLLLAGSILFQESFDDSTLPSSLVYDGTDPFFEWRINGSNQLFADRTESMRGVATAISDTGFDLEPWAALTYSAEMGTPEGAAAEAYNVGLVFGGYVALFHPGLDSTSGFPRGSFRLEEIDGTIDPREPALLGNLDMGFAPVQGQSHLVEATVSQAVGGFQIDVTVSGIGTDSAFHTFGVSFLDPTPSFGDGNIGVALRGGAPPHLGDDGYFDNMQLEATPVPEPSTLALLSFGLAGAGIAACRRRRRKAKDSITVAPLRENGNAEGTCHIQRRVAP